LNIFLFFLFRLIYFTLTGSRELYPLWLPVTSQRAFDHLNIKSVFIISGMSIGWEYWKAQSNAGNLLQKKLMPGGTV